MINKFPRIYISGHRGMVGSAIKRLLISMGHPLDHIITRTREELNLTNQNDVKKFFNLEKPDQVYLAAAKVGGINANNSYPAEFIYENLMIETNVIHYAFKNKVKKLLFLGSSCIYPRETKQPICEDALLTGTLEPTNEAYAIAKIAGIKLCESYNRQYGLTHSLDYRSVMPTNLYGPGDSYHQENSHVIPGLIRRFHEAKISGAKSVAVWGSGEPKRDFLHVDDLAKACLTVMELKKSVYQKCILPMLSHINIGSGKEISIRNLALLVAQTVGFTGKIIYDVDKPDGTLLKMISTNLIQSLGWSPSIDLQNGLKKTYEDFILNK